MKQLILKSAISIPAFILLLSCSRSMGQSLEKARELVSGFNHKTYRVNVALPRNYSPSDTVHYPVLYVLDGRYNFTSFSSVRDILDLAREVKDIIIVGIDGDDSTQSGWLANRFNDFTPSASPQQDSVWSRPFNLPFGELRSGGAPAFLQTLSNDIIPYIDSHYKTNSNRGLFGHSLGGMFAAYCLLTEPDLFQEYSINSPSLWWNNGELMAMEKVFIAKRRDLEVRIFMSVGALEGPPMVSPLTNFADVLQGYYPRTLVTKQVFDNETHVSVVASASSRTLKVLYGR